jgi:hypothetical protein
MVDILKTIYHPSRSKGWSHFVSTDLLRWTEQSNSTMADGDTGSVSITEAGQVAAVLHSGQFSSVV